MNRVSPALAEAMIPALETSESVKVDFPWSTWAMTEMFLMLVAGWDKGQGECVSLMCNRMVHGASNVILTSVHQPTDLLNCEVNPASVKRGGRSGQHYIQLAMDQNPWLSSCSSSCHCFVAQGILKLFCMLYGSIESLLSTID